MWMDELRKEMWDDSQIGKVKDFRASRDAFNIVLNGHLLAAIAVTINPSYRKWTQYVEAIKTTTPNCMMYLAIRKDLADFMGAR
jgi:hypothetical protein